MASVHVTPPEALRIHREIKARWSLASHWGTFQLTDEALSEPPLWLEKECAREGLEPGRFQCLKIGESFLLQEGENPLLISGEHPDPESRETRS